MDYSNRPPWRGEADETAELTEAQADRLAWRQLHDAGEPVPQRMAVSFVEEGYPKPEDLTDTYAERLNHVRKGNDDVSDEEAEEIARRQLEGDEDEDDEIIDDSGLSPAQADRLAKKQLTRTTDD